jgi:hypothetical protein
MFDSVVGTKAELSDMRDSPGAVTAPDATLATIGPDPRLPRFTQAEAGV